MVGQWRAIATLKRNDERVSDSAPLDELDHVWDNHFIGGRQIKLPFQSRDDSSACSRIQLSIFFRRHFRRGRSEESTRKAAASLLQICGSLLVDWP